MELLVKAGLSPFEVLESATIKPFESLDRSNESGSIAIGKRADLIILGKDPLGDIKNTREIAGVIIKGKLLTREYLDELLEN